MQQNFLSILSTFPLVLLILTFFQNKGEEKAFFYRLE